MVTLNAEIIFSVLTFALFFFSMGGFFHKVSNKIPESYYVLKTKPSILPHFPWTESQIATLYR